MEELNKKIYQWGVDRKIIGNGKLDTQLLKLVEEMGELASSMAKNKPEEIKDAIGDMYVVLVMICGINGEDVPSKLGSKESLNINIASLIDEVASLGILIKGKYHYLYTEIKEIMENLVVLTLDYNFTYQECVEHAYNQIKDRKGYLNENGVFIKEE